MRTIDLGRVTAYADAVAAGYTGTREQFATDLANAANYAGEAGESEEAAAESAWDSEAYAVGTRGGAAVASDDPAYHNNAKYYSDQAHDDAGDAKNYKDDAYQSKQDANDSAGNASTDALKSEGYALGKQAGADVSSGSPYYHNNSKYYSDQAGQSAQEAGSQAGEAEAWATGEDAEETDPQYHNNSKYYSEQASGSAGTASNKADNAAASALVSEGYAVGKQNGAAVASGSPYYQNNASYHASQAAASAAMSAAMTGLAPAFSTSTAYSAGDYVLYNGTLYRFTSAHAAGAWTGSDAVAATLGPDVSLLKSDLNIDEIVFTDGYYLKNINNSIDISNPVVSTTGYKYALVACSEGDVFTVSGTSGANYPIAWAFTLQDGTILEKENMNVAVTDKVITAPSNAFYLVINAKDNAKSYKGVPVSIGLDNAENDIIDNTNAIIEICKANNMPLLKYESINGYLQETGNILTTLPGTNTINKYKINSTVDKIYMTCASTLSAVSPKYCILWFVRNGVMMANHIITVDTNPQTWTNYEINVPDDAEEVWAYYTAVLSFSSVPDFGNQWKGKSWYAYGTSLTSELQGKYVPFVAQFSGLNVTNKGIPGGGLVANRNVYNALNDLTDGKINADLITIEVGANDWDVPLGDISGMDINTFCGALNHSLQTILMNCPKAQVVLMCSTRQRTSDDGTTLSPLNAADSYGVTYEEKNEAIRRVAVANGIYYIPFGSGLGLGLFRMQSSNLYNVDHIHHTELGGYNLAKGVWSYLRNIPNWYNTMP